MEGGISCVGRAPSQCPFSRHRSAPVGLCLQQVCARSAPQGQEQTTHTSTLLPMPVGMAHYYQPVTFLMESITFFTLEYYAS